MSNDPRAPLPGQQPGTPQNPQQGSGMDPEQGPESGPSTGSEQQPNLQGETAARGATASSATSAPAPGVSEQSHRAGRQTGTVTAEPGRHAAPPRTYEAPRKSTHTRSLVLVGVLVLAAVAGIITGFAATGNQTPSTSGAIGTTTPLHAAVPPGQHLLSSITGSGLRVSTPFTVTHSPVTATYSYNCGSGSHRFTAAMATSRTNIQTLANTFGPSGTHSATVVPNSVGGTYRLAADSRCPYQVSVYQK